MLLTTPASPGRPNSMGSLSRPGNPRADAILLSSTKTTYGTNRAGRGEADGAWTPDLGLEAEARLWSSGWRGEVGKFNPGKKLATDSVRPFSLHVQPMRCRDCFCRPQPSGLNMQVCFARAKPRCGKCTRACRSVEKPAERSPSPHCFHGGVYIYVCVFEVAPLFLKQGGTGRLDGVHLSAFAQMGGVRHSPRRCFPAEGGRQGPAFERVPTAQAATCRVSRKVCCMLSAPRAIFPPSEGQDAARFLNQLDLNKIKSIPEVRMAQKSSWFNNGVVGQNASARPALLNGTNATII
jgi:hypothetical protein